MPERNPKDNVHAPTPNYGWQSLDSLARTGVAAVEFWCVSGRDGARRCRHQQSKPIDDLIRSAGPATTLLMLARQSRCDRCKQLGCHVQPADPPSQGTPEYREFLRDEMLRCQRFLMWAREQF